MTDDRDGVRTAGAGDDEFDDSDLDADDMVDILDNHERGTTTPYQSPAKPKPSFRSPGKQKFNPANVFIFGERPSMPCADLPDFEDPEVMAELQAAEQDIIREGSSQHGISLRGEETLTISRLELDFIKQATYRAGYRRGLAKLQTALTPGTFPFLSLPAELRLVFYSHYFTDRNPATNGKDGRVHALPTRLSAAMIHCCPNANTWCQTPRPWISTSLLATCKQIYAEARDDFLYKDRHFYAPAARHSNEFRRIDPALRFWQYIQHLDLDITSDANRGMRFETGNLIVHLVALLKGGSSLKTFKLKYLATGRSNSIERFSDLQIRGAISITQVFKDWHEPADAEELQRKQKLERLLLGILGCACEFVPPVPNMSYYVCRC